MKYLLLSLIIIISVVKITRSQISEVWYNLYNSPEDTTEEITQSELDSHENLIIAISSNYQSVSYTKERIIKYDGNGKLLWTYLYKYQNNLFNFINRFYIDQNDNIYLTGNTYNDFQSNQRIYLVKLSQNGDVKWSRIFDNYYGDCFDITGKYNNSNVYLCGDIYNGSNVVDFVTLSYDSNGTLNWYKTYNGLSSHIDYASKILVDSSGNVTVSGHSYEQNFSFQNTTIQYSSSGDLLWKKHFNLNNVQFYHNCRELLCDFTGNIYVGGQNDRSGFLLKYSAAGSLIHNFTFVNDTNFSSYCDYLTIGGNYLYIMLSSDYRQSFFKLDTAFNVIWSDFNSYTYYTGINSILVDNNTNSIFKIKNTYDSTAFFKIEKYNTDNILTWSRDCKPDSVHNFHNKNVMLRNSNIYVTGGTGYYSDDIYSIKYSQVIGINNNNQNVISGYSLSQNYPNPFNPLTTINYEIKEKGFVVLKVYDMLGKEISILINKYMNPGLYSVNFEASSFPSGIYFYRLEADNFSETKRMVLVK